MTMDQEPERGTGGAVPWPPPPTRPAWTASERWGVAALVAGLICSVVVGLISAGYALALARGEPPSIAMVSMIADAPFLLVGFPLLLIGSLRVMRPWAVGRPRLNLVVVGGVIAWFIFVLEAPVLLLS
jgi:hypothetical protein